MRNHILQAMKNPDDPDLVFLNSIDDYIFAGNDTAISKEQVQISLKHGSDFGVGSKVITGFEYRAHRIHRRTWIAEATKDILPRPLDIFYRLGRIRYLHYRTPNIAFASDAGTHPPTEALASPSAIADANAS